MARDPLFTGDFWMRSSSQAIHAAAGAAIGPLASLEISTLKSLPWQAIATSALVGALVSLFASLSSQGIPGSAPASFLPDKSKN
jgi:hypothetical protein